MYDDLLFNRNERPFGISWEEWAALWCRWMLSIPKKSNPSTDLTGKYCGINQSNQNVWFLTGTFGNAFLIRRKCTIQAGKAIFFPILEKEDSFTEDSDLKIESELIRRSKDATDKSINLELVIDGIPIEYMLDYRVQSNIFDLEFPEDNVYEVKPGLTRSVCDGYWAFIKPPSEGKHHIYFKGETALEDPITLSRMKEISTFNEIKEYITKKSTFRLEVLYELNVIRKRANQV